MQVCFELRKMNAAAFPKVQWLVVFALIVVSNVKVYRSVNVA